MVALDSPVIAADAAWVRGSDEGAARVSPREREPRQPARRGPDRTLDLSQWTADAYQGAAPDIAWLIENVLPLGVPAVFAAAGGIGKSNILLRIALAVSERADAPRQRILGGEVVSNGAAVILTAEDGKATIHRRLEAIDPAGARLLDPERLIIVPLPDAGGPLPLIEIVGGEARRGPGYDVIRDAVRRVRDLRFIALDPLQAFVPADLNSPEVAQLAASLLGMLAAETQATVVVAHHMRKFSTAPATIAEARELIRGTGGIVDSVRVAIALWEPEEAEGQKIARSAGHAWMPGSVIVGAIVKANEVRVGSMMRMIRHPGGALFDLPAIRVPTDNQAMDPLIAAVRDAAALGQPYTRTGAGGLYTLRARLPEALRRLSKHRLEELSQVALDDGRLVLAVASGSRSAKWLDVPQGPFARGVGEFAEGALATPQNSTAEEADSVRESDD